MATKTVKSRAALNLMKKMQTLFAQEPNAQAWVALEAAMYAYQQIVQIERRHARSVFAQGDTRVLCEVVERSCMLATELLVSRCRLDDTAAVRKDTQTMLLG